MTVLQEIKPASLMTQASNTRLELSEMIEEGGVGSLLLIPTNQAALIFGISEERLSSLGKRGQELRIWGNNERLTIGLYDGIGKKKEAYSFLYTLTQACFRGQANTFLDEDIEIPSLLEELPGLETLIEIMMNKGGLTEIDQDLLQIYLYGVYHSLRDKDGLHPPERVFQ